MGRIITIGREFGTGGRELGRRLAEELKIEYYDKEIVQEIAKHTSFTEDYVKSVLDNTPHALFPITIGRTFAYNEDYLFSQTQQIFQAQSEIITELAEKSDCVIIGRCADYILREKNPFKIFVYADTDFKINRCKNRAGATENLSDKQLKKYMKRVDKGRAKYYQFYTGKEWGAKENYDIMVNTTGADIKAMAKALAKLF